jgi:hypothetical protein
MCAISSVVPSLAGLGLDDDLLVPHQRQLLADHARERIRAAAGREADDDADRPVRPDLREHTRDTESGGGAGGGLEDRAALHGVSPVWIDGVRPRP